MHGIKQYVTSYQSSSGRSVDQSCHVLESVCCEYRQHISGIGRPFGFDRNACLFPCRNHGGWTIIISVCSPAVVLAISMPIVLCGFFHPADSLVDSVLHYWHCTFLLLILCRCSCSGRCACSILSNVLIHFLLSGGIIAYLIGAWVCRIRIQSCIDAFWCIRFRGFGKNTLQCRRASLVDDVDALHHSRIWHGSISLGNTGSIFSDLLVHQFVLALASQSWVDDRNDALRLCRGRGNRVCGPVLLE